MLAGSRRARVRCHSSTPEAMAHRTHRIPARRLCEMTFGVPAGNVRPFGVATRWLATMSVTAPLSQGTETLRQEEDLVLYRSVSEIDRSPQLVLTTVIAAPSAVSLQR